MTSGELGYTNIALEDKESAVGLDALNDMLGDGDTEMELDDVQLLVPLEGGHDDYTAAGSSEQEGDNGDVRHPQGGSRQRCAGPDKTCQDLSCVSVSLASRIC